MRGGKVASVIDLLTDHRLTTQGKDWEGVSSFAGRALESERRTGTRRNSERSEKRRQLCASEARRQVVASLRAETWRRSERAQSPDGLLRLDICRFFGTRLVSTLELFPVDGGAWFFLTWYDND